MITMKPELRLLLFLVVAAFTVVACDAFDDLAIEGVSEINSQGTGSSEGLIPSGPTPTRRPVPTPLPTEEPDRPRSESANPTATAVEMREEQQAELGPESIIAAQRAGLTVEALRATIVNENLNSGESQAILLEFVRPNSYRMVTEEHEIIIVSGQTYFRDNSANWLVSPGDQTQRFEGLFDPFTDEQSVADQLEALSTTITEIRLVGEESLSDRPTQIVTYSEQAAGDGAPLQTTLWIGLEDGLFHRQVITFGINDENFQITTEYEYGDSIRVEPPFP